MALVAFSLGTNNDHASILRASWVPEVFPPSFAYRKPETMHTIRPLFSCSQVISNAVRISETGVSVEIGLGTPLAAFHPPFIQIEADSKRVLLLACWGRKTALQLKRIGLLSVRTDTLEGGVVVRVWANLGAARATEQDDAMGGKRTHPFRRTHWKANKSNRSPDRVDRRKPRALTLRLSASRL